MIGVELTLVKNQTPSKAASTTGTEKPQQFTQGSQRQNVFQNCLEEKCSGQEINKTSSDDVIEAEVPRTENENFPQHLQSEEEYFSRIILLPVDLAACLNELKQIINYENLDSVAQIKQVILDKIQELAAEGKISVISNEADITSIKMPDLLNLLTTEAAAQGKTEVANILAGLQKQADVSLIPASNTAEKTGQKDSQRYSMADRIKAGAVIKADVVKDSTEPVAARTENSVRNVMEYESNRLASRKLSNSDTGQSALGSKPGGDEPTRELVSLNRLDNSIARLPARDSVVNGNRPTANVDIQQLIDQVVKKAELMVKSNSSEMKIDLKPEFLGKMTIKIAVEEGVLTARFITDSHQVKHLLDNNLNTLKQSLETQGIKVEKAEVNVQLNSGGMFDGSEYSRQSMWDYKGSRFNGSAGSADDELKIEDDVMLQPEKTGDIWQQYNGYENDGMSFLI